MHRAATEKIAAAAAVCAFFKAMAVHQPRMFPGQRGSARSLALHIARLLRNMTST
jgi:hypothetical protein